jgi:hypothetical protein
LASVSADDVRDVINVSSAEVPDVKVLKMIRRAEVTLELETGKEIDCSNCSDAEKEYIMGSCSARMRWRALVMGSFLLLSF